MTWNIPRHGSAACGGGSESQLGKDQILLLETGEKGDDYSCSCESRVVC